MKETGQHGRGAGPGPQQPAKGVSLANRFELLQLVGRTASGSSWLARDQRTTRTCLVRFGDAAGDDRGLAAANFALETEASTRVRSAHVLNVLANGDHASVPFIVQELLVGESLDQRVQHTGPVLPSTALQYVAEAASALCRAHGVGLVHGCLTPSRVFLARSSGREVVKLLDFGAGQVSKLGGGPRSSSTQVAASSSPEQITEGVVTDLSDIWALAVVSFFALTGHLPFHAKDRAALSREILSAPIPSPILFNPALPAPVAQWVQYALERKPGNRFRTPNELAITLAHALGLEPHEVGARPPSSARARFESQPPAPQPESQCPGSSASRAPPTDGRISTSQARQAVPSSQPSSAGPGFSMPPSKRTVLGVGSAAPPPSPADEPRRPSTIRGMAALVGNAPADFNRTLLGVGEGAFGSNGRAGLGPSGKASQLASGAGAQRPGPSARNETIIGVGNVPRPQGIPPIPASPREPKQERGSTSSTAPPRTCAGRELPIDAAGADLRRTLGGMGLDSGLRHVAINAENGEFQDYRTALVPDSVSPRAAALASRDATDSPQGPRQGFFVPRQSTLLGVAADDAAELATARDTDRQKRAVMFSDPGQIPPSSPRRAARGLPTELPNRDHNLSGGSDSRYLVDPAAPAAASIPAPAAWPADRAAVPRTTLKPAPVSQRLLPLSEPPRSATELVSQREPESAEVTADRALRQTQRSRLDEAERPLTPSTVSSRWIDRRDPPCQADHDQTPKAADRPGAPWLASLDAEPPTSERFPPSTIRRQLLRKRKALIVVVISVVALMLLLLGGAMVAQQLRAGQESPAEKHPSLGSRPIDRSLPPIPTAASVPAPSSSSRQPVSTGAAQTEGGSDPARSNHAARSGDISKDRAGRSRRPRIPNAAPNPQPTDAPQPGVEPDSVQPPPPAEVPGSPNYGI